MKTLDMLHRIEKEKVIYDIHYCRAGIGFLFYDPPEGYDKNVRFNDPRSQFFWRKYLVVDKYYPTFEQAVKAEFGRLASPKHQFPKEDKI